jgi:hypothetical protein
MQMSLSGVTMCARRIDASRAAFSSPYPLILTSRFPALLKHNQVSQVIMSHDGRLRKCWQARKVLSRLKVG